MPLQPSCVHKESLLNDDERNVACHIALRREVAT